ncbi:MAG: SCP2 sterol-binding domain-containing protein [Oscillospiraceae bacterium]|jgi:putative sterol carrier protein|nr:SCP2 sterol-binding domain-containing protein [Oscillospiraceae bacterium]
MEFMSVFTAVKESLAGVDATKLDPDFAVQVNIIGSGAGAFYIANKGGAFQVEPYDYVDRDGAVTVDSGVLLQLAAGELTAEQALAEGKINFQGNPAALLSVFAAAAKPAASAKPKAPAKPKAKSKAPAKAKAAAPEAAAPKAEKPAPKAAKKAPQKKA